MKTNYNNVKVIIFCHFIINENAILHYQRLNDEIILHISYHVLDVNEK